VLEATNNLADDIMDKEGVMFDAVPILVAFLREKCSTCILTCTGKLWVKQVDQLVHIAGGTCLTVMSNLSEITERASKNTQEKDMVSRCSLVELMDKSQEMWFSGESPTRKRMALTVGEGGGSHAKRSRNSP